MGKDDHFKDIDGTSSHTQKFESKLNSKLELPIFFAATMLWTWIIGFIPVLLGIQNTTIGNIIFMFGG